MAWNYEESKIKLSKDFKSQYIIYIKGKKAVLLNGLKVLAHLKGIKKLVTSMLQYPKKDNGFMAIVKAHLVGYEKNPITNKIEFAEYSAIGDASPRNCSSMVAPAYIRMAESRAVGRCLGNYTNIGIVTAEEIMEVTESNDTPMTQAQNKLIAKLVKEKKLSVKQCMDLMIENCNGKTNSRLLNAQEASNLIEVFKAM